MIRSGRQELFAVFFSPGYCPSSEQVELLALQGQEKHFLAPVTGANRVEHVELAVSWWENKCYRWRYRLLDHRITFNTPKLVWYGQRHVYCNFVLSQSIRNTSQHPARLCRNTWDSPSRIAWLRTFTRTWHRRCCQGKSETLFRLASGKMDAMNVSQTNSIK